LNSSDPQHLWKTLLESCLLQPLKRGKNCTYLKLNHGAAYCSNRLQIKQLSPNDGTMQMLPGKPDGKIRIVPAFSTIQSGKSCGFGAPNLSATLCLQGGVAQLARATVS
jgi:hypothetical protein